MRLLVPFPLSPLSPLSPLAPLSPLSPLSLLSPITPLSPLAPLSPLSPLSLMSPITPLSPLSPLYLTSGMDFNPFQDTVNFVDLLNSQQNVVFGCQRDPIIADELPSEHKERRTWTPTDDLVLISSWLNTSKDPVVGNDQKGGAFWTRIAAYFCASPKLAGCEKREASQCKHRWHKLNELVSKFCWADEAATREKTSGMNENDVIKSAHEIYYNNNKKKFTIEHAWKELRTDQK